MEQGLIHIYCGNGKGKTTAALGLALRCAGGGGKVMLYQFLKDGSSSEIELIKNISNIEYIKGMDEVKFSFMMNEEEKLAACKKYISDFNYITENCKKFDMLVLDEALHAVNLGFLSLDSLLVFLDNKPKGLEVVITGTKPHEQLKQRADYITEMVKIKHPYDKGIGARRLVEM